jgi:hypothetical protein
MQYKVKDFDELEKIVNSELKLRKTKGSGSVHGNGDGKGYDASFSTYEQLLAECKYSSKVKKSISVKKSDWLKTKKAAIRFGRIPLMAVFTKDYEDTDESNIFVTLELHDFKGIYMKAIENSKKKKN